MEWRDDSERMAFLEVMIDELIEELWSKAGKAYERKKLKDMALAFEAERIAKKLWQMRADTGMEPPAELEPLQLPFA